MSQMLSKKHFLYWSAQLRAQREKMERGEFSSQRKMWEDTLVRLGTWFGEVNPRFRPDLFSMQCKSLKETLQDFSESDPT